MKKYIHFLFIFLLFLGIFTFPNTSPANPIGEMIQALIAKDPSEGLEFGFMVEDLNSGEVVYSQNPELLLNPASNTKILTSFVALSLLKPDFTFKTQLLIIPSKDSSNLFALTLKGMGDPFFTSMQLQNMVHELKEKGIKKIEHLYVDGSFFDGESFPGQMEGRQKDAIFNCNVGALSIDHNLLEVVVNPEEKIGKEAKVSINPPLPDFPIKSEVSTTAKGGRIIVKNNPQSSDDLTIDVKGAIALKAESQSYKISVHHPSQLASLHLLQALKNEGIEVSNPLEFKAAPFGSLPLIENKSLPLLQILQEMNKQSDNFIAEQLTKYLGAKFMGSPGTTEKGTQVIIKKLKETGINTEGLVLENGSGLSKLNRMSVHTLSQIFYKAYKDVSMRGNFVSTLSILGLDGTLRKKFRNSDVAGRFFGKTGTLNGVSALTGYLYPKSYEENHSAYIYSYIINGTGKDFWKQKQNFQDILELLLNM